MRRRAEDVQAIPYLHLLQLAEMRVEHAQCVAVNAVYDAEIAVQPLSFGERDDLASQVVPAAFVDAGSHVIFIDESLELGQRSVHLGAGHRRHQMIDDNRGTPSFCLTAFARIVDDERIDQRHRAESDFGPAGFGEAQRLAGEPFEVAVLAEMDDRVGAKHAP